VSDPADTARTRTLLISAATADELLKWMHGQSWPGSMVTRMAKVIEQLETFPSQCEGR
jgi:hypothetical protein